MRGVVGVARFYDQAFGEAEAALLEAVAASICHAMERIRLSEERDRLYREADERSKAARVIGSIADGVMLVDEAGVVRLWNPAAEAITGLPADAVLGRPLEQALPGLVAVGEMLVVADDPSSSPMGAAAAVPVDVAGRELWLSIRGVSFSDGMVYAFHDLTEAHRLEQLKADFIATVSHELRTPLAAVHGAAKTLERDDIVAGSEVFDRLLGVISEQSDRLATLVNDILLASRVASPAGRGRQRADRRRGPRHPGDRGGAGTFRRGVAGRAGRATVAAAAGRRSREAPTGLTNLVANAAKYSPDGGRIQVELEADESELRILVRDEGLGIAAADQSLIFERFYRADANMTRGVSGSGLGLYISRELVNRMGGAISVESQLGEGSTFTVTLPLTPASRLPSRVGR